jgi:FAD dependent oxidoreductase TIGR03364
MGDRIDEQRCTVQADVCVVGAGILGLAHALEARRRGLNVVVLERDASAVGASVRNFGHVFVTSVADGEDLQCALAARERWLALGTRAGLAVERAGTVIVARRPDELALLAAVAGDPARRASILTPSQLAGIVPLPTDELLGAMHCTLDLRVDPRAAVAALARLLEGDRGGAIHWRQPVVEVEPGLVRGSTLTVRAPLIVVCPGPELSSLPISVACGVRGLTRCALQMLRVAAPGARRYGPALATGLSLIRYPAFADRPQAAPLRARLTAERPELLAAGIHLLVTQLPDGDLIVGDTHDYGETPSPFRDERLDELLLAEARRLLGAGSLRVRERWQGIYAYAPQRSFAVTAPLPGVRVAQVVCGLGMTLAFGLAIRVLDELLDGSPVAVAAPGT